MQAFRHLTPDSAAAPVPSTQNSLLKSLTTRITTTYRRCNPHKPTANSPSPILTEPATPMHNYGLDNDRYELIVRTGDILGSATSFEGRKCSMNPSSVSQYKVLKKLGQGTFGQVFRCLNLQTNTEVAVKVLKNKKAYFRQGLLEVTSLLVVCLRPRPAPPSGRVVSPG